MERRLKEQEIAIRAQEKEIRETNEFMVDALSTVVESRNAETGDHTKRIKFYTRIMANCLKEHFPQYGLTDVQVDGISRASVLHDIGKIGISDTILLKPGRLTNEEFEIMKTHTTIGCDMLEKLYRNRTSEFTVIVMRSAGIIMSDGTEEGILTIWQEMPFRSVRRSLPSRMSMMRWSAPGYIRVHLRMRRHLR